MLYTLLEGYFNDASFLNLFRYLSFRSVLAFFTSLLIAFLLSPKIILYLKNKQKEGQPIREDGPKNHLVTKKGTPTMGGLIVLLPLFISTILWTDLTNQYVWVILFIIFSFASLGFADDYLKLLKKNSKGMTGKQKLLLQFLFSFIVIIWIQKIQGDSLSTKLYFPIFKNLVFDLGIFFIIFAVIVLVGSSNAVNLTDGLDGLAIVLIIIATLSFAIIAYIVGNIVYAKYLYLPYIEGAGEFVIIAAGVIGSSLVFLWYNSPPAKIFMGDTGSMSLGAMLGTISIITKNEIILAIIGGVFVVEAISVIIQVYYYKLTKRRFFRMAPIHHHFEYKGWSESTIVIRFWIIAIILCVVGLITLKLR